MISQFECDQNASEAFRSKLISEIRAELVAKAITLSDIPPTQSIKIYVTVKKVRNRPKIATTDRYIITVHLHA